MEDKKYIGSTRLDDKTTEIDRNWDMRRAEALNENLADGLICEHCNSRQFFVYVTNTIDDARLYCVNCKRMVD